MELLFAAFFTTASASTSLVLLLLQHPAAISKIQQELAEQGLGHACSCGPGAVGGGAGPWSDCSCQPDLNLAALGRLRYVDCVIKEVLRLLPPVSGGYRTALRTFELDVSAPRPLYPRPTPASCVRRSSPHAGPPLLCQGRQRVGGLKRRVSSYILRASTFLPVKWAEPCFISLETRLKGVKPGWLIDKVRDPIYSALGSGAGWSTQLEMSFKIKTYFSTRGNHPLASESGWKTKRAPHTLSCIPAL